jgi:glucose-6-phosphate isomerase
MVFAALCDRQYGFVYDGVRARGGLAWFPICDGPSVHWQPNPAYNDSVLEVGTARQVSEFGVQPGIPLYRQFEEHPDTLQWVSDPTRAGDLWTSFNPLDQGRAVHYWRT